MAQTRTGYRLIDDSEVDAESPIPASLAIAWRDQWQGAMCDESTGAPDVDRVALPQRAKTSETNTRLVLVPDGSGGVDFVDPRNLRFLPDTSNIDVTTADGTYTAVFQGDFNYFGYGRVWGVKYNSGGDDHHVYLVWSDTTGTFIAASRRKGTGEFFNDIRFDYSIFNYYSAAAGPAGATPVPLAGFDENLYFLFDELYPL